ncbi:hypothetical protein B0H17DRAFT_1134097 [Mycena rosella]|uniref:Uncharacterized protein n=1 Tax=Mycena rosella TaxID=1033263 RepID=A0AAD7DGN4_MYCRO|nr:hypothetical protein B0H17DRAFT_1134097 [Mycena rosella]
MLILVLAIELIQTTASEVSWADEKNLRATCRTLSLALDLLILTNLVVDSGLSRLARTVEKLESLSDPTSRRAAVVKNVWSIGTDGEIASTSRFFSDQSPSRKTHWENTLEFLVHPLAEVFANSPDLGALSIMHETGYQKDRDGQRPCFHHLLARENKGNPLRLAHLTLQPIGYSWENTLPISDPSSHLTSRSQGCGACLTVAPQMTDPPDAQVFSMLSQLTAVGKFPPMLRAPWEWAVDGSLFPYLRAHPGLEQFYFKDSRLRHAAHHWRISKCKQIMGILGAIEWDR